MDPEVGFGGNPTTNSNGESIVQDAYASGIDVGYYPRPRTFMFGANLKF